mmetsp:Transcript_24849/g.61003  ORF Transcript_24849/g.61003 Transcript_24849/m.61003 type:complete len:209 (+) Transcript_24849:1760-2386(+)
MSAASSSVSAYVRFPSLQVLAPGAPSGAEALLIKSFKSPLAQVNHQAQDPLILEVGVELDDMRVGTQSAHNLSLLAHRGQTRGPLLRREIAQIDFLYSEHLPADPVRCLPHGPKGPFAKLLAKRVGVAERRDGHVAHHLMRHAEPFFSVSEQQCPNQPASLLLLRAASSRNEVLAEIPAIWQPLAVLVARPLQPAQVSLELARVCLEG